MRLNKSQQKRILNIAVSNVWVGERMILRQLFDVCELDHREVRGYLNLLDRASKVVRRAKRAIDAMEQEEIHTA